MTNDFQIVFHNIDQSTSISDAVNKRISKLQRFCDRILPAEWFWTLPTIIITKARFTRWV